MNVRHSTSEALEQEPAVIGDRAAVDQFLNSPKRNAVFPEDPLANHIHQMLQLHPSLELKFRAVDLAGMDEVTKQLLLEDINEVLGIIPLQRT